MGLANRLAAVCFVKLEIYFCGESVTVEKKNERKKSNKTLISNYNVENNIHMFTFICYLNILIIMKRK